MRYEYHQWISIGSPISIFLGVHGNLCRMNEYPMDIDDINGKQRETQSRENLENEQTLEIRKTRELFIKR